MLTALLWSPTSHDIVAQDRHSSSAVPLFLEAMSASIHVTWLLISSFSVELVVIFDRISSCSDFVHSFDRNDVWLIQFWAAKLTTILRISRRELIWTARWSKLQHTFWLIYINNFHQALINRLHSVKMGCWILLRTSFVLMGRSVSSIFRQATDGGLIKITDLNQPKRWCIFDQRAVQITSLR